jgi:hypothetical protein
MYTADHDFSPEIAGALFVRDTESRENPFTKKAGHMDSLNRTLASSCHKYTNLQAMSNQK